MHPGADRDGYRVLQASEQQAVHWLDLEDACRSLSGRYVRRRVIGCRISGSAATGAARPRRAASLQKTREGYEQRGS
jgi:hypothetical protein